MKKQKSINEQQLANFRFSVIAPLLTLPKDCYPLSAGIKEISEKEHLHPMGELVKVSESTIWRWMKKAQQSSDPLRALQSEPRTKRGIKAVSDVYAIEIRKLRQAYPFMTTRLLFDNLPLSIEFAKRSSYATVLRFCESMGLLPKKSGNIPDRAILAYEHSYVNSLWHLDFHHGKETMQIVDKNGQYRKVYLIAIFDDCSRFALHAQWYFSEGTECLIHALKQAFLKYGLPTCVYQDNGSAMISHEYKEGLKRLGVDGRHTKVRSPYMNGKVERPWNRIENRFLEQLDTNGLSLEGLNLATQAWLYQEYNVVHHHGIKAIPRQSFFNSPRAGLAAPASDEFLEKAFTIERIVTVKPVVLSFRLHNIDFQLSPAFDGIRNIKVAFRRWDFSYVYIVNDATGDREQRVYPVNKQANASGKRAYIVTNQPSTSIDPQRMAPLLARQVSDFQEQYALPTHINSPQDVHTIDKPLILNNITTNEDHQCLPN